MKLRKIHFATLMIPLAFITGSCSDKSTKAAEPEVTTMDSVSNELDKTNRELDEKTEALEASLEKVDQEFKTIQ